MIDIPTLGTATLCAILVTAAYTFAVSIAAARGRPHLLRASRMGTFATIALVVTAVLLLAYAFQTHDFRIRYVARYSDRSMDPLYLITSLWGGQDGSLLWWSFLLSGYTFFFTIWIRDKHREIQPYAFATLMSILGFFVVLMLFAANPFATTFGAAPADGEGLNPLLQNYWMVIHPPALYLGLTGWAIPFAILVGALATGKLDDTWHHAARRWVLVAWAFLSLGNMLGMFWSYEELGWGGYWAWDPVENASFMPWLTGTAYLHSVMVTERRGMLKVWNVFLLGLTFIMTIFGTFLTRSGLIASVHSFARSDIGIYFAGYLVLLVIFVIGLIAYRVPKLKAQASLDSMVSREFAFLMNNWILLFMMVFILASTTFPLLSEWIRGETTTVGPPWYNKWMVPFGLMLLFLTGVGPLISWRKATGKNLRDAFIAPVSVAVAVGVLHAALGTWLGFAPLVEWESIYDTAIGAVLGAIYSVAPIASTTLCAFVLATVVQEFVRGTRARRRSTGEIVPVALFELVARAKRRYGGYVVHVGIVLMFIGFTGAAYDVEREASLQPGQSMEVGGYTFTFARMREDEDGNKRMLFGEVSISRGGDVIGQVSPAKFVYRTHPEMPTTEVAIRTGPLHDLYVVMSGVDVQGRRATFRIIKRPLVAWIWVGGAILLLGTLIAVSPSVRELLASWTSSPQPARAARAGAAITILLVLAGAAAWAVFGSASLARAQADSSSTLHAGTVEIHSSVERRVFDGLLCMCGDCQRLPLSGCACGWAENMRAEVRAQIARGDDPNAIMDRYRERFGARAISIPGDSGLDRALWAVPISLGVVAAGVLVFFGRRWARRGAAETAQAAGRAQGVTADAYDERLDRELRELED